MDIIKIINKIINQYAKHYPMTLEQKINARKYVIYHIIIYNNLLDIPYLCKNALMHYLHIEIEDFDYALYRKIINNYVPPINNISWLFDMFLKKNRIYRKFYKAYKKARDFNIDFFILGVRPEMIIKNAFNWKVTEQGRKYWDDVNQIFKKFINKHKVQLNQTDINKLNSYIVNK